jgi:low affinity IgE Fc receptor
VRKASSLSTPSSPPYTWSKAKTACEQLYPGGYLASIESKCENEFVFGLLGTSTVTWLGADDIDPEGTWQWIKPGGAAFWQGAEAASGGKAVADKYANFNSAEPNNGGTGQDCLVMTETGEWRDQMCSKSGQFLCETPATVGGETNTPPTTIAPTTVGRACSWC